VCSRSMFTLFTPQEVQFTLLPVPPYYCPHHLPAIHPSLFPLLMENRAYTSWHWASMHVCVHSDVCVLHICPLCVYICDYICLPARSHRSRRGMEHRTVASHPWLSTFSQTPWPIPRQKSESMTSDLQIKKHWYWDFSNIGTWRLLRGLRTHLQS
jgi:hypothetical protein